MQRSDRSHRPRIKILSCMLKFALPSETLQFAQLHEIARSRRRCRIGYGPVVGRIQPAPEAIRALGEHSEQGFLLPRVHPAAKAVEEPHLCTLVAGVARYRAAS